MRTSESVSVKAIEKSNPCEDQDLRLTKTQQSS